MCLFSKLEKSLDLVKGEDYKQVTEFTQQQVDHLRLGYEPPMLEIGTRPAKVQFAFQVRDKTGKKSPIHTFDITITPVDNQPPVLIGINPVINVDEGMLLTLVKIRTVDIWS